jgi:hypothetical protein
MSVAQVDNGDSVALTTHAAAASAASSATGLAVAIGVTRVTPQTLFKAGVQIIFTHLNSRDWRYAQPWRACRAWYAAARTQSSIGLAFTAHSSSALRHLIASPLGSHMTSITLKKEGACDDADVGYQTMLNLVSEMSWVRRVQLDCYFDGKGAAALDFTRLGQLKQLESFETLHCRLSLHQLRTIKQLSSLRSFQRLQRGQLSDSTHFGRPATVHLPYPWAVEELRALCSPPHQLHQFTHLSIGDECGLTAAHLESLVHVPQLVRLDPLHLTVACLPYLHRFTNLECLRLRLVDIFSLLPIDDPSLLRPHLAAFGLLQRLDLVDFDFTVYGREHLFSELISAMPALASLNLRAVDLDDLSALASSPSLTALTLRDCRATSFAHLCQLSSSGTLRHLHVQRGSNAVGRWAHLLRPLTNTEVCQLQVPSMRLPGLESFSYSQPSHADDHPYSQVHDGPHDDAVTKVVGNQTGATASQSK